ncbi:MAG TPA: SUMF1/EgtB/PvdO family nonheme iron enzyme [Solirubrobacteraceae bacterium]|jgi:iron(II)-dependent oxidoreductase
MSRTTALEDAAPPADRASASSDAARALANLDDARGGTLALVADLCDADLERVHSPIMSPLVWDLGHIAAYEDLWLGQRHAGLQLLRPDLAELYDAFETPRAVRGEIEALGPEAAREYLAAVRARTAAALAREGLGDGTICEMVLRHELQHSETMRQTMAIAGLLPAGDLAKRDRPLPAPADGERGGDVSGEWIAIPAGPFAIGADGEGFAYDNERPRHTVELRAFQIARLPVSNASWMRFSEGGGYERREWWSDEGWAWKLQYDITHHPQIAAGHAEAPACHVSWFEADAFARAHDARLPTEAEWERAATSEQEQETPAAIGQVWEWTTGTFHGYPGFRAHPYREYSEVFFGEDYRVLRGSSWATHPRVAGARFRNWDLPIRRQIFAGVRLARDNSA